MAFYMYRSGKVCVCLLFLAQKGTSRPSWIVKSMSVASGHWPEKHLSWCIQNKQDEAEKPQFLVFVESSFLLIPAAAKLEGWTTVTHNQQSRVICRICAEWNQYLKALHVCCVLFWPFLQRTPQTCTEWSKPFAPSNHPEVISSVPKPSRQKFLERQSFCTCDLMSMPKVTCKTLFWWLPSSKTFCA